METNSAQHDVNDDGSVLASFGLELRGSYTAVTGSGFPLRAQICYYTQTLNDSQGVEHKARSIVEPLVRS